MYCTSTYLPYEVFCEIREVVWSWYIFVIEEIRFGVFWLVTIAEEELEEMKQSQPLYALDSALKVYGKRVSPQGC